MTELKQKAAIHKAATLGLRIRDDYPEIADKYRRGFSLTQIAQDFSFDIVYGVNFETAREATRKAITGYNGEIKKFPQSYSGLIFDKQEQKKLEIEHKLAGVRKVSEQKLGVVGLSLEERSLYSKKGVETQGKVLWVERKETENLCVLSEIEFAYLLSKSLDFKITEKHNFGKTDIEKIAQVLNKNYHQGENIRTPNAVCSKLIKFKKLNGKKRLL